MADGLGDDDLAISQGRTGVLRYAAALASTDEEDRKRTFEDLRASCARDTLAMVTLREALGSLARETGR